MKDSRTEKKQLLQCPFCGSEAVIEQIHGHVSDFRWSVGCTDEDCISYQSMKDYPRKRDAVTAWNKRAHA